MGKFGMGYSGGTSGGAPSSSTAIYKTTIVQQYSNLNVPYNYGNLYNWYAVNTGKLAPTGYRVPTSAENTILINQLGGSAVAGGVLKTATIDSTNKKGWSSPNTGATNAVNFNFIPSGYRHFSNGSYYRGEVDGYGYWRDSGGGMVYILYNSAGAGVAGIQNTGGIPIRCMRDATASEQLLTDGDYVEDIMDIDGNWYKGIKIGTQVWLNNNLKTTKYNDGTLIPEVASFTDWGLQTSGAYCTYNNLPLSTHEDPTYYYTIQQALPISNDVVVPLATMICTSGTLVILNNSTMYSGYTRNGNTFTFGFDLNEGDTLIFKN